VQLVEAEDSIERSEREVEGAIDDLERRLGRIGG
jgi:hypothetical protein